jgi:Domain of unknown function (DUF6487)
MADAAKNPLPSGPALCRICGKAMGKGYLSGDSIRPLTPANLAWTVEQTDEKVDLTSAGWFAWSRSPRIPGFQCEECGIIELHLQSEDLAEEETDTEG